MFRKNSDVKPMQFDKCHDGVGTLICKQLLTGGQDTSTGLAFFHEDILPPGVSIGMHLHKGNEEVYYLVEGECTMLVNDEKFPMKAGDISNVRDGHSHGIINTGITDAKLIVFAVMK